MVGDAVEIWSGSANAFIAGVVKNVVGHGETFYDRGEAVPPDSVYIEYGPSAKWVLSADISRLIRKKSAPSMYTGNDKTKGG